MLIFSANRDTIMAKYIYQYDNWPDFKWNEQDVQVILGKVRHRHRNTKAGSIWWTEYKL